MVSLFLLLFLPFSSARLFHPFHHKYPPQPSLEQVPTYTELWFQEDLDHINRDPGSIDIRALRLNSPYSLPSGPLIVYLGGETPIEWAFNGLGFLTTNLSQYWNCTVYFLEHRYYGESLPKPFTWNYLSTEQVLYDYADIIMQLRPSNDTPVVVTGASYAGMLAAWMRMKYPHVVDGAIASSAPVFMGLDNGSGYFANVTGVLNYYGCSSYVQQAFYYLSILSNQTEYWPQLSSLFHSCSVFKSTSDIEFLNQWLLGGFANVVQFNYPPSWPANATCQYFNVYSHTTSQSAWGWVQTLAASMQVAYNASGTADCFPITGDTLDYTEVWNYQICTEMWCPQGTTNVTDVFPPYPWDPAAMAAACSAAYGVYPRTDWVSINYGMSPLNAQTLKYASNIMFTDGQLDPWLYGCVKSSSNPNIVVKIMQGGAHATDFLYPTSGDTQDIRDTRTQEISLIQTWVNSKAQSPTPTYA